MHFSIKRTFAAFALPLVAFFISGCGPDRTIKVMPPEEKAALVAQASEAVRQGRLVERPDRTFLELVFDTVLGYGNTRFIDPALQIQVPMPPQTQEEVRAELDELIRNKALRTPDRVAEIYNQHVNFVHVFDNEAHPRIGSCFRRTYFFSRETSLDMYEIVMTLKAKFNRIRPAELDPRIEPVIDVPWHKAYPAGHSVQSHVLAHFYSHLDPQNRERYFAIAHRISENREVAGLHYPSDRTSGKIIAQQIFDAFMKNPAFVQELENSCR